MTKDDREGSRQCPKHLWFYCTQSSTTEPMSDVSPPSALTSWHNNVKYPACFLVVTENEVIHVTNSPHYSADSYDTVHAWQAFLLLVDLMQASLVWLCSDVAAHRCGYNTWLWLYVELLHGRLAPPGVWAHSTSQLWWCSHTMHTNWPHSSTHTTQ